MKLLELNLKSANYFEPSFLAAYPFCLIYRTASQVHLMKFSPDGEFFATAGKVNFENTVAKLCVCTTLYFKTMCTPALVCTCVCGTYVGMCTQSNGQ